MQEEYSLLDDEEINDAQYDDHDNDDNHAESDPNAGASCGQRGDSRKPYLSP
jgi:hypothetical protein